MGSLNNGNRIIQARSSVRQLGGAYTVSADRVETSTTLTGNQRQFSADNPVEATVAKSAVKLDDKVKVTDVRNDSLVERISTTGVDL